MLSVEQPQVVARYPKYEAKYGELMNEIIALEQAKDWAELNRRFNAVNPRLRAQSPFPMISEEHEALAKELGLW